MGGRTRSALIATNNLSALCLDPGGPPLDENYLFEWSLFSYTCAKGVTQGGPMANMYLTKRCVFTPSANNKPTAT